MKLDVVFTPAGLTSQEVQGRTVFVIDILRATTTMCAALHSGARALIPVAATEEALRLAQTIGSADVLLAGERQAVRIPGFQLGNSPLEMTETAVRGKTLIVTTSNGTKALLACQGAGAVYPACAGNLSLAAEKVRETIDGGRRTLIVCAGREGAFSLDDAYAAGRLVAAALGHRRPRPPPQRRGHRRARPGPALRRRLGAPAPAEPGRPGAAPAGVRRRHRGREPGGCLSGADRTSTSAE
jgi:2-phosphosulfolactate phosphatase